MGIELTDQNFQEEILDAQIPALVDFWAPWCGPCKMIAPVLDEISTQYKEKIKVGKLNVDDNPQIAAKYSIMSIPTLIIFKQGEIVDTIVGALPKAAIEEKINKHV